MSFILDALKKSESERQRQAGPALLEMRIVRPTHRLPVWALAIGFLLILSVAALAWLVLRPTAAPATAAVTGSVAPANVPASNAPAVSAGPATGAAMPAAQAPGFASAGNAIPPAAAGTSPPQSADATDDNPADTAPAVAQSPSSSRETSSTSNLRTYAELGSSLPELRLDLHVYATNPAERYAFINMHKVHEGDTTAEGVQVREITREGVVLDYRGTEFLLGRQ